MNLNDIFINYDQNVVIYNGTQKPNVNMPSFSTYDYSYFTDGYI